VKLHIFLSWVLIEIRDEFHAAATLHLVKDQNAPRHTQAEECPVFTYRIICDSSGNQRKENIAAGSRYQELVKTQQTEET
jgi:hypothetical protein